MILSATLIAVIAARLRPTTIITVAILGVGVLIALTGAVTSVGHVVVLLFAVGWFVSPLQASVVTLMQTGVPDGARGRVMATLQASMAGASVGSMALAGLFGDLIGIRAVFFAGGAIVVIGGLLGAVLYRGARQIDQIADVADETGDPDMTRPGTTPGLDERLAV